MTTGSIDLNRSPFSRYTKSWTGTNYPVTTPSNLFQAVWKKVEKAADPELSFRKEKWTYLRVWEERRKKRRTIETDHPYAMTLQFWTDSVRGAWDIFDFYPPYAYLGTTERYFRELYADGYSSNFSTAWSPNNTIALQGKLREKIVGSDFDMSVFLGEGRQTLALIADTARRLANALAGFRGCDPGKVARALGARPARVRDIMRKNPGGRKLSPSQAAQAAASAWLELQYGWMPLLKDAEGAAQALAQQLNEPAVQTYRARKKVPLACVVSSSNIKTWTYRGEIRGQLIAKLKEVNVASLNGLTDPSSMLWELLPWSFVADWFIPIGSYLSARGLAQSVSGSFITTITRREYFETISGLPLSPVNKRNRDFNYRSMKIAVDRTVSSSLSTPLPSFKPLAKVASWQHCVNAVALLTVGFSSGKPTLSQGWRRPDRKANVNMSW
jgi:hypothetical protein